MSASALPVTRFDIEAELPSLRVEAPKHSHLDSARTLVHLPELRVVLIAMCAGASMKPGKAEGACLIQVLRGELRLDVDGAAHTVTTGQGVALERGVHHELHATADTDLLLTIGWDPDRRG